MFNDIPIGPVTIHMYGLMIAIGFISAYYLCAVRGKKQGLSEDILWGIFCCAVVGGLAGTRILYYIVELPAIFKNPSILWDFKNGYVVYGGIIGGVLVSYIYIKKKKADFLKYFDLVMPSVALAQCLGRMGCFFAGCCYGKETDAWYGITFHDSKFAPNNVKLVPTQLLSAAGDLMICLVLIAYSVKKPVAGRVGSAYLILYGVGRFAIEFVRNDYRGSIGWMSTSQLISIGVVAIGILLFILLPKVQKSENTDEATEKAE